MSFTMGYIRRTLRSSALHLPGACETLGRDGRVVAVDGKPFVYLGRDDGELTLRVRLPESAAVALTFPGTAPAPGALGRARWVTATYARARDVPFFALTSWIDESYRAIASRRRLDELPLAQGTPHDDEEPELEIDPDFKAMTAPPPSPGTSRPKAAPPTPSRRKGTKAPKAELPF